MLRQEHDPYFNWYPRYIYLWKTQIIMKQLFTLPPAIFVPMWAFAKLSKFIFVAMSISNNKNKDISSEALALELQNDHNSFERIKYEQMTVL